MTICSEGACPFWEPGGAALFGRCVFDKVDFQGRPELVLELSRLRDVLERGASGDEERGARGRYHQLLNESGDE